MASLPADPLAVLSTAAASAPPMHSMKTRRLSASGSSRRRADARDAALRAPKTPLLISSLAKSSPADAADGPESPTNSSYRNPDLSGGSGGVAGRRRGTIFKCESCSKIYRHPSCLIKHRWEHSPHWAESSKLPLSKHQQVQLLEGAAILSHLSVGASLPEDRAAWPSWTSGGALPMPAGDQPAPTSSSVPATTKRGPVKAGFAAPANARVREVAPGVLVAPSSSPSASPSPQLLPVRGAGPVSEIRPGVFVAPIAIKRELSYDFEYARSTASYEARSPTAGLDALASFSLSLSNSNTGSSSLPQSSVRSSSGATDDEPELSELDEMEFDEREEFDEYNGKESAEWDEGGTGMDMDLDMEL